MRVSKTSRLSTTTFAILTAAGALTISAAPLRAQGTTPSQTAAVTAPQTAPKKPPSPKVLATWRGQVINHLNSRKSGAVSGDGTTTVAFKIDRSGKVMSSQVVASSGNKTLDAEALALTQRASPVPAPPAEITGSTLYLKVPVRFKK
jgi:periplasmic protein TonB